MSRMTWGSDRRLGPASRGEQVSDGAGSERIPSPLFRFLRPLAAWAVGLFLASWVFPASSASGPGFLPAAPAASLPPAPGPETRLHDLLAPVSQSVRAACGCDSFRIEWRDLARIWEAASRCDSIRVVGASSSAPEADGRPPLEAGHRNVVVRLRGLDHGHAREFLLAGRPFCWMGAWVARRDLRARVIVQEGDVALRTGWFPPDAIGAGPAGKGGSAIVPIGSYTLRGLTRDAPIVAGDLQPAPLVRRGEGLRVVYSAAGIRLEGRGVAKRDGWGGDRIAVRVDGAGRDCYGLVTGAGQVEVRDTGGAP